jgi:hypothetical protein
MTKSRRRRKVPLLEADETTVHGITIVTLFDVFDRTIVSFGVGVNRQIALRQALNHCVRPKVSLTCDTATQSATLLA